MASFLKSLLRALKKMATRSSPPAVKTEMTPRNTFIFPESLLNKQLQSARDAHNLEYYPDNLLEQILAHPHAVDLVGTIYVTTLYYYKHKNGTEHEYLVVKVEDSIHNLSNYIKIDRCSLRPPKPSNSTTHNLHPEQDGSPAATYVQCFVCLEPHDDLAFWLKNSRNTRSSSSFSTSTNTSSVSDSLGGQKAKDLFHVSAFGTLQSVAGKPSKQAAIINFPQANRPTLDQLLVLADTVSKIQPKYHLLKAQCYWYAFTIWEVLRLEFEGPEPWPPLHAKVGGNTFMPGIKWHKNSQPKEAQDQAQSDIESTHWHTSLLESYRIALAAFMEKSAARQNVSNIFNASSISQYLGIRQLVLGAFRKNMQALKRMLRTFR